MKLFFSIFFILSFALLKAQTDPVKSAERVIHRSATSTEKRLEQTANKEIDRKINQTLTPTKVQQKSDNSGLKTDESSISSKSKGSVQTNIATKTETKESQVKNTSKPAQKNNDTKAHGSLIPPSK